MQQAVRPQDLPRLPNWSAAVAGEGVFSAEECERIIALSGDRKPAKALGDQYTADLRNSRVSWVRPDETNRWLFTKLRDVCQQVNAQYYHLELLGFTEPLQIAEYSPDQHFKWHLDMGPERFSIRKLSLVVQLSDPDDYEGGELQVMSADEPTTFSKARGTVVVFPSYVLHRVTPVTRGTRFSLAGWVGGPHLR